MDRKQNSTVIEKMVTYDNGLISEDHNFNEDTLSDWVLEACEFAFDHFKEKDNSEMLNYAFEYRINTVALRLMMGLKKVYPQLKSSKKVSDTILSLIENEKYADGRRSFILTLWENKLDTQFIEIIQKHISFWENPLFASVIVLGLTKRRIAGFAPQVRAALEQFTDKRGLHLTIRKSCQKYLTDEPKYKHFSVFLERDGSRRKKP
ncbi:hypothetical protein [Eikenella corrodens]|uniref:DNA alkylation repair protein n=1 Tax=Eikenella corrodens TaxID=539 RepID=A0A3S9SIN4_EIKCO|nr:hypothetical protein [Eikenella corrodens]AZR59401.1 hypothetical protein ELB75_04775 [Eikenella corrodens]